MTNNSAVTAINIRKNYGAVQALDSVSINVNKGEAFAILGPNGAGKTTLIESMLGTTKMDAGSCSILGFDPLTQRERLYRKVGVQFQDFAYQHSIHVGEICDFISIGICAIGLMALPLTLSDYREKKILKRLMVTPVHPGMLLAIQFTVQTIMALFSALLVIITALLIFQYTLKGSLLFIILSWFLVLISIFSIGLLIASRAKDAKQTGLLCSLAYFPMLLFSGTTIPYLYFRKLFKPQHRFYHFVRESFF